MVYFWKHEAVVIILKNKNDDNIPLTKIYNILNSEKLYNKNYSSFTRDFKINFTKSDNGDTWIFTGIDDRNQIKLDEISSSVAYHPPKSITYTSNNTNSRTLVTPFDKSTSVKALDNGKEKILETLSSKDLASHKTENNNTQEISLYDINEGIKSTYYKLSEIEKRLDILEKSVKSICINKSKEKDVLKVLIDVLRAELFDNG